MMASEIELLDLYYSTMAKLKALNYREREPRLYKRFRRE